MIHKTQMSNSRKPAFKWVGLKGVILAIEEIKKLVKTVQLEYNSNDPKGCSDKASTITATGVQWLARQRSVQNSSKGVNVPTAKSTRKTGRNGI